MIEHYLRPTYQKWMVNRQAKWLEKHISPNTITIFACITGIGTIPFLMQGKILYAVTLVLISGYLDTLDGTVARNTAQCSQKGTILDILCDRIVEASIIIGLFGFDPVKRAWYAMFMMCSVLICITSFLVIGIFKENNSDKGFYYNRGLIERPEAFFFFILMICLPNVFSKLAIVFSILVLLTSFLHLRYFFKYTCKFHG